MSSENDLVTAAAASDDATASVPTPQPAQVEHTVTVKEPIQSTSEANIAATDPNVDIPASSDPTQTEPPLDGPDVDMKAADTAEGESSGAAVVAPASSEDLAATPSSSKKSSNQRRKSSVPEHKSKKLGRKKSMPTLRLNVKPGEYYFARLKGHAPWPAIICDEEMLPDSLTATRPVTALRPDGTYREDFQEGGKNAKDRTYPVMFLYTNEFAWLPNIDLAPLDTDEIKDEPQGKKGKKLYEAYKIASEGHDLEYFKQMMDEFRAETRRLEAEFDREEAEQKAKQEEKAAKKDTKAKRKSKAADDDDGEGENAGTAPKSATKKRKKSIAVEETEENKPTKTPKTLKVSLSKSANGESSAKSKGKSKPAPATPVEIPMTEEEKLEKKQKSVLYLRHRLQKGFLQDAAPAESEMATMAAHFDTLEQHQTLEAHIIKNTKIHKVLKAIIKLDSVPMDDEYNFKDRSHKLLQGWNKILADGTESGNTAAKDADTTNGVASDDKLNGGIEEENRQEKGSEVRDEAEFKTTGGAITEATPSKVEDVTEAEMNKEQDVTTADVEMKDVKDAPAPDEKPPAEMDNVTISADAPVAEQSV